MKRRDFIRVTSAAGVAGMIGPGYNSFSGWPLADQTGFDLHPFIKKHPEAVFICLTSVGEKSDAQGIHDTAYKLGNEMFVKTFNGEGYPNTTKIAGKPNWTCAGKFDPKDPYGKIGINTDTNFMEGFLKAVRNKGPQSVYLRDCACPSSWPEHGWTQMAARNNFDCRDLTTKDFWDLAPEDIIFRKVNNGVVFKEIGFMAPMTAPDSFLINIAKFKAHGMGITSSIKNLQGTTAKKFHQFCGGVSNIFESYDKRYHGFFQPDYMERMEELHAKHVKAGIPRWDRPHMGSGRQGGGLYMEHWVQRMLDSFSVTPTGINIVEGVYGRDGDGFNSGSHNGKPMDFMSNNVIFGKDAFRVDIITHWLAGQEPGNFGLFHIGIERGMSNVLDPFDIPVYLWNNGKAKKVKLDSLKRTPLLTYYLQKNYNGQTEPQYHLCDEPFDYKSWKSGKIARVEKPSIRAIGTDTNNKVVMEVEVPEESNVYVDIKNKKGEVIWRMPAEGLEPGVHEVVWDGFSQPGMYTMYVKGMGWDAEREMVIYA